MMSSMLLSYIVPVYNTRAYLAKCLDSLFDQGLQSDDFEVLVVDDGSTDGSRDVVEAMLADRPQLRLITQANAGVSAARNHALDQARGRYVQFVDSDDYLERGMMARLLQRAVDEDLDVLQFNYKTITAEGQTMAVPDSDDGPSTPAMRGVAFLDNHRLTPYVWRFLVRRDYLEEHRWRFDTSLIVCEDGALIAKFMLQADRVAYSADAVYCYVNRGDSAMHNSDRQHLQRRILSQIDSAALIDATAREYEQETGRAAPASVHGLRNVYLYFAMTKALTSGCVDEAVERIRRAGLFPFPCVGPEANYYGKKWKVIHTLMMRPRLWSMLSRLYQAIKKS